MASEVPRGPRSNGSGLEGFSKKSHKMHQSGRISLADAPYFLIQCLLIFNSVRLVLIKRHAVQFIANWDMDDVQKSAQC